MRRAALDGLVHPTFLATLPKGAQAQVKRAVKAAGPGDYASIRLGYVAADVHAAAKTLQSKPRVPKRLAAVLPELERIAGY
jgi:tRNA A37 threonylcarbamoyladenosine modification protein TsaB